MIRDFFFVLRVLVYSALIALVLQVQWKGESLEQKTMRWVTQSSIGGSLTNTAQKIAWKLSNRADETSRNVNITPSPAIPSPKARTLIELKRTQPQESQSGQEYN